MKSTTEYLQRMKNSGCSEAKAIQELIEDVLEDIPKTVDKLHMATAMANELREWAAGLEIAVDQDLRRLKHVAKR